MAILTAKTFEPSAIAFGLVEKNKLGGKYIPLTNEHGAKTRITIQTPAMSLPFGISAYRDNPAAEPQSYSADLSFRDMETDENVAIFYNKVKELDAHLMAAASQNSVAWFGKQKSPELLADTYRQLTKQDASGKYAPNMKFKIQIRNGKPDVRAFDIDKSLIDVNDIPRGSKVKIIAEIASIWQVGSGTQWGVTFAAKQILIVSKPQTLDQFAFADDDEEVKEDSADEEGLKFL